MVDNEVNRHERVDLFWIAASLFHRIAHRSKIHDNRYTGEILQNDTCRDEWNFLVIVTAICPAGQLFYVFFGDSTSVELTNCCFKQHFNGERKPGKIAVAVFLKSIETVVAVRLASDLKTAGCGEMVLG
ncbi:hypothetical protein D3C76_1474700 [compost metagenome]